MRILFTSTGGDGHLLPLLPLAGAFAARGEDVRVAAPSSQRERLERERLPVAEVGPSPQDIRAEVAAHRQRVERLPIRERRAVAFSGRFGRIEAPLRLDGLRRVIEQWAPDTVVYESADLAAPIAALEAGIPFVHHAFGRAIPQEALRMAATAVAPLWDSVGLEPDPLAGAYTRSYVDICPPSLRTPLPQRPRQTFALRPVDAAAGSPHERDRPTVYATLGTIFNDMQTFRLLLDALATIHCDAVLTIGRDRSAAELAPIPSNVTVLSYLPQAEILDRCDAVIAHGGSGSMLAALAYGRPLVLLPQGADQFDNAHACAALGTAEVILPQELAVDRLGDAITAVLNEPGYADVARSLAGEIAGMPSPATVADQIASRVA